MVTACSEGLPDGKCALARNTPESTQAAAVALVLWQGDQFLQVTVRVGRHGSEWVTRNLSFTERDALVDRWTAVGLTVATLVGEGQPALAPEPPAQPPLATGDERHDFAPGPAPVAPSVRPTPGPSAPGHPAVASKHVELTAALGGLVGPSWRNADWQRGLWMSLTAGQRGTPWIVEGFASYAHSAGPQLANLGSLQSRWLSAGVGLGAAGSIQTLNLRCSAALELLFRRVSVDLGAARAGDDEIPIRLRLLGAWPARGMFGVLLGGALRLPFTSAPNQRAQVTQPPVSGELQAGLEVRL